MRFLARRIVHGVFLLAGVSLFSFMLLELAPGDFFEEMRLNPQISAEAVAGLRKQFGLDRPLPVRYARWLQSVAKGELGFSFSYNSPVRPLLEIRARNTLLLTSTATGMAWLLAIPLGVWAAAKPRGWLIQTASRRLMDQRRSERSRRERETLAAVQEPRAREISGLDDTLILLSCVAIQH